MASSVDVSVEVLRECMIQEVTLDGQEVYVLPLSMSENLTKLAHKIDFSKDETEDKGQPISEIPDSKIPQSEGGTAVDEEEDDNCEKDIFFKLATINAKVSSQPHLWPWDSVRNKLKSALTELTVLHDILTISRDRKFMTLDFVPHDPTENKSGLLLVARKRALLTAGNILNGGLDRLRKCLDGIMKNKSQDFHYELLKLRKSWRLKRVGSSIIGDLSYKSAGSRYYQSGSFEVSKSENDVTLSSSPAISNTLGSGFNALQIPNTQLSNLSVTVPNELVGLAYIRASIKITTGIDLTGELMSGGDGSSLFKPFHPLIVPNEQMHWTKKLEAAQNVIFCKEIFAELAKEAIQMNGIIPNVVIGNQIILHLFPEIKLCISLYHSSDKRSVNNNICTSVANLKTNPLNRPPDHNHLMEHALHQLLRDIHFRNSNLPMPHPVSAPLGLSRKRKLAGPHGYTKDQLNETTKCLTYPSILEQAVKMGKLCVVRQRLLKSLDEYCIKNQEPQLIMHAGSVSLSFEYILTVVISFSGFDCIKTGFTLIISYNGIKVATKDGLYIELLYKPPQVHDFILKQISEHHIILIESFAKLYGWNVLSCSNAIGIGNMQDLSVASGIMIASPYKNKLISVKCSPIGGYQVFLSQNKYQQNPPNQNQFIMLAESYNSHLHQRLYKNKSINMYSNVAMKEEKPLQNLNNSDYNYWTNNQNLDDILLHKNTWDGGFTSSQNTTHEFTQNSNNITDSKSNKTNSIKYFSPNGESQGINQNSFKLLNMSRLDGRNFAYKMEALMAMLTPNMI